MSNMTVVSNFDFNQVEKGKDHKVNLMVSLTAPHVEIDGKQRPLLNLVAALDISGSMGGLKMTNMKDSVIRLINHLSPSDRLGLVVFDTTVEKISDPVFMSSKNKDALIEKVQGLKARSTTNIAGAVQMSFEMLSKDYKGKTENTIHRAILFTDGNANVGIDDYSGLVGIVKQKPENVTLSTFGYGNDHDEETLSGMAKVGKGNSFYVKAVSDCAEFFGLELGGLLKTFAKNIKLRLIPEAGIKVNKILNDFAVSVVKEGQEKIIDKIPERIQVLLGDELYDEVIIDIDDMYGNETRHILSELSLPAMDTIIDEANILKAVLTFENINAKTNESEELDIGISFVGASEVPSEPNSNVIEQVLLLDSAQIQYDAREVAKKGDTDGARDILKSFRTSLADVHCYASSEKLQALGGTIKQFDTQLETGGFTKDLSKNILYCSTSLGRGRGFSKDMENYGFMDNQQDMTAYAADFANGSKTKDEDEDEDKKDS